MSNDRIIGDGDYLVGYDMRNPNAREILKFHREEMEQELNAKDTEGFLSCAIIFKPGGKTRVFANVQSMGAEIEDERIRKALLKFADIPSFGGGK